jgi:hypothetical protein
MIDLAALITAEPRPEPDCRNYRHRVAVLAMRDVLATVEIMASMIEGHPDNEVMFDLLNQQLSEGLSSAGERIARMRQAKDCAGEA